MHPVVHPAVAYLAYAGYTRITDGTAPANGPTLALLGGAVLPDVIDQPLYHLAGAPTARTVGHAAIVALLVSAVVVFAARRGRVSRVVGEAFAFGYLSHLLADAVWPVLLWLPAELRYLGWPVTHQPPYAGVKPLATVGDVTVTTLWVEVGLLAAGVGLWLADGHPGIDRRSA